MWEPVEPGPRNRAEIAALRGLILSALATLAVVLAALSQGCAEDTRTRYVAAPSTPAPQPAPPPVASWRDEFPDVQVVPPGAWTRSPRGVEVWLPAWLDHYPALRVAALDEIDSTEAEDDPRYRVVGPGRLGPPPGWRVVGMDPGSFSFQASPTGLANGYVDFGRQTIYVAWRATSADPRRYPALAHEHGHAWAFVLTGDTALATQHGHPTAPGATASGAAAASCALAP